MKTKKASCYDPNGNQTNPIHLEKSVQEKRKPTRLKHDIINRYILLGYGPWAYLGHLGRKPM